MPTVIIPPTDVSPNTGSGSEVLSTSPNLITPTISVGATTTAATDLLVNPAVKASGNLLDLQVASSSKFSVSSAGNGTLGGNLTVSGTGTSSVAGTLNVSGGFILNRINAKGIYTGTSDNCGFTWTGTNGEFSTASGSLILKSAGTTTLTLDAYQNAILAGNLFVNGTAASTFAGSIATTGANLLFQASTSVIDHSAGLFRAIGYGPNTATAGGFSFIGLSSNGSVGGTRFSIDSSGNPIFGADQGSGGTGNIRAYFGGTTALSNGFEINTANSSNVTLTFRSYVYGYSSNPRFVAYRGGGGYGLTLDGGDYTATTFAVYGKQIIGNTYSQNISSTADLTINPATKTSGNLLDAQVNGSSKFAVDFAGNLTVSGGTITGGTSGMSLASGGTNQNITLTPSGTGFVTAQSSSSTGDAFKVLASGGAGLLLGQNSSAGQGPYIFSTGALRFGADQTERGRFAASTGNLLLGTTTDSGNGKLQLATHTTSAGGIGFGTDTSLYRHSITTLALQQNSGSYKTLYFYSDPLNCGIFDTPAVGANYSGIYFNSTANSATIATKGTTAITVDSSQNATFAGNITLRTSNFASIGTTYVSTTPTDISIASNLGGMYLVTGNNVITGAHGVWLLIARNSSVTVVSADNNTGLTVTFSLPSGKLQAVTTSGTLALNCTSITRP